MKGVFFTLLVFVIGLALYFKFIHNKLTAAPASNYGYEEGYGYEEDAE